MENAAYIGFIAIPATGSICESRKPKHDMRDWQKRFVAFGRQVLVGEKQSHLYLRAPTATGKSRAMYELSEHTPEITGTRVFMVGMAQIVGQLRDDFVKKYYCKAVGTHTRDAGEFITPSGKHVYIGTYQGLAAMAKRDHRRWTETGFLFFDEAHIGGSNSANALVDENDPDDADAPSFIKIRNYFRPTKKVYISATLETVDENILGEKAGHMFNYTLTEAYEDGILHYAIMQEVHTGINAKIRAVEAAFGRNMEELQTIPDDKLLEIIKEQGDRPEKELAALARGLSETQTGMGAITRHDVNLDPSIDVSEIGHINREKKIETLKMIVNQQHREMINVYAAEVIGEQAIFYSPRIEYADRAAMEFNRLMRRHGNSARAYSINSKDQDRAEKLIGDFTKGENNVTVLFVVGMLQEGFSKDDLWLAFDCNFYRDWSVSHRSRFVQKIGRLLRLPETGKFKPVSRYYFARQIMDYYRSEEPEIPTITDGDIQNAQRFVSTLIGTADGKYDNDEPDYLKEAVNVPGSITRTVSLGGDDPDLNQGALSANEAQIIATPLYYMHDLVDVYGYVMGRTIEFTSLLIGGRGNVEENKRLILALPAGSPRPHPKSKLGQYLNSYINKSHKCYDSSFETIILAKQREWRPDTTSRNIAALLALPEGSPKPHYKSSLGKAYKMYTSIGQTSYKKWFDEEMNSRQSHWRMKHKIAHNFNLIISLPEKSPRPHKTTKVGKLVNEIFSVRGKLKYPEKYQAICDKFPHWIVVDTVAENMRTIMSLPENSPRPCGKSTLGRVIATYTNPSYRRNRPELYAAIHARFPYWFKS